MKLEKPPKKIPINKEILHYQVSIQPKVWNNRAKIDPKKIRVLKR